MKAIKVGSTPYTYGYRLKFFLEPALVETDRGLRLSLSGFTRYKPDPHNIESAGQIIDEFRALSSEGKFSPGWNSERVNKLVNIWERWHLNDMRPGCEHQRAAGWDTRPINPDKPTNSYGKHYEGQRQDSWNMLTWVRPDEYPEGLLTAPCPECGYRYGTEWVYEPLPDDVIEFVRELIAEAEAGEVYV